MIKKIIKYFLIIIFLSAPVSAEPIKNIVINGNKRVSEETIKIYGKINSFKSYSEINSNKILKNLYGTGFLKQFKSSLKKER